MFDLSDAVIIIPVRIDQSQRLINLQRNIAFLKEHLSTRIYVIEQDCESKIPSDIDKHFVRDGDTFYKTRLFNTAVQQTTETVLFFLDVDVLVDPMAYNNAYERLLTNKADVCLLYSRNNKEYHYVGIEPSVLEGKDPKEWMGILSSLSGRIAECEGGIVAFRRNAFLSIGGFNERFIGYGHEDAELLLRAKRFGLRYEELPFSIYHQNHEVSYMWDAIKHDYVSKFIRDFIGKNSNSNIFKELCPSSPKYVTVCSSGGRLGNVLFQLAGLFQYAKATCRKPYMTIPHTYRAFFQPLFEKMSFPESGLEKRKVESYDASTAVFHTEFPLIFDSTPILELSGGYLQSPELLKDVRWTFQDCLGSKEQPYPETRVLIHIRRGDYNNHSSVYEQLGEHYYSRAINVMKCKIPDCKFIVFSDDIPASKAYSYLQRDDVEFFDDSGMSAPSILQEMSRYSSFIIANSTFSLWGVLLSKTARTVIAPIHWTRTDTPDCLGFWNTIYEPHWIRISNRPLTILCDDPQFDCFKPKSSDSVVDIAIYTKSIPLERPNAKIVAVVTNHVETFRSNPKPSTIDYMFSSNLLHIDTPHPSWNGRPFVFVDVPGSLMFFHYIQTVTETLLKKPKISTLLFTTSSTRPSSIFQNLNSIYLQTEPSWEILLQVLIGAESPTGKYLLTHLAIPKLLCTIPISPSVFHAANQVRSDIIAYTTANTLMVKTRFERQLQFLGKNSICATNYTTEQNEPSIVPASIGSRVSSIPNIVQFRSTFMFYKHMLNSNFWFSQDTYIRMVPQSTVRFVYDIFTPQSQTNQDIVKQAAPPPVQPTPQSILINGLTHTNRSTFQTRLQAEGRRLETAKKAMGFKYIL